MSPLRAGPSGPPRYPQDILSDQGAGPPFWHQLDPLGAPVPTAQLPRGPKDPAFKFKSIQKAHFKMGRSFLNILLGGAILSILVEIFPTLMGMKCKPGILCCCSTFLRILPKFHIPAKQQGHCITVILFDSQQVEDEDTCDHKIQPIFNFPKKV